MESRPAWSNLGEIWGKRSIGYGIYVDHPCPIYKHVLHDWRPTVLGDGRRKENELFINFIFKNSLKLFLFLLYKDSCCWNETQWTTYLSTINKFNSCFTKEKIYKVALIKWTNEIWCVQAKAVILLGLKWFTVNDGVTTTEVGHGAGVEFIVWKKKRGLLVFIESF